MTVSALHPSDLAGQDALDPALISRLANEAFAALPGHPQDAVPQVPASESFNASGLPAAQVFPADLSTASGLYFLDGAKSETETQDYAWNAVPDLDLAPRPFDPHAVKRDFPILQEQVHGKPLVWLDNGATTQKPQAVIDRLTYFLRARKLQHPPRRP
jgi:cysteine desulfurase/selenocysteine lyase